MLIAPRVRGETRRPHVGLRLLVRKVDQAGSGGDGKTGSTFVCSRAGSWEWEQAQRQTSCFLVDQVSGWKESEEREQESWEEARL